MSEPVTSAAPVVEDTPAEGPHVVLVPEPEAKPTGLDRIGQPWAAEAFGKNPLRWGITGVASLALAWLVATFTGGITGPYTGGSETGTATTLVWMAFMVAAPFLFVVDAKTHRIPNRIMFPLTGLTVVLLLVDLAFGPMTWGTALSAVAAGAITGGYAFGIWFMAPERGYGWGDVKLTALAGLILGTHSIWLAVVALMFIPPLLAIVPFLIAAARSKEGGQTAVPFGPFLISGIVFAAFAQVTVTGWNPLLV